MMRNLTSNISNLIHLGLMMCYYLAQGKQQRFFPLVLRLLVAFTCQFMTLEKRKATGSLLKLLLKLVFYGKKNTFK